MSPAVGSPPAVHSPSMNVVEASCLHPCPHLGPPSCPVSAAVVSGRKRPRANKGSGWHPASRRVCVPRPSERVLLSGQLAGLGRARRPPGQGVGSRLRNRVLR